MSKHIVQDKGIGQKKGAIGTDCTFFIPIGQLL